MKTLAYAFILGSLFLVNCSDDGVSAPIQRIEEIGAFDVGNAGDASDIEVGFSILNVAGISEFRVFVIPSNMINNFNEEDAFLLTEDRYKAVPLSDTEKFTVQLSGINDVSGEEITTGRFYIVKILMLGENFTQLSMLESNELSIQDQGIYNGYYEGIFVTNITPQSTFLLNNQEVTISLTGDFLEDSATPNGYVGQFNSIITTGFQTTTQFSSIRFSLDEGELLDFNTGGYLSSFLNAYLNCTPDPNIPLEGKVFGSSRLEVIGEGCSVGKFVVKLERAVEE